MRNRPKHPLCVAVQNGHAQVVEFLLDMGCNISMRDNEGFLLLCLATIHDRPGIVRLLLDRGACQRDSTLTPQTPDFRISHGKNRCRPVQIAAWLRYYHIVKLLLRPGHGINKPKSYHKQWAVHCALRQGHTKTVMAMVKSRVNLNFSFRQPDRGSEIPPLAFAARQGNKKLVDFILRRGRVDPNYCSDGLQQLTPLYSAVSSHNLELVKPLVRPTSPWLRTCSLANAIRLRKIDIVRVLLESGAPQTMTRNPDQRRHRIASATTQHVPVPGS